jgi:hypothetical protein
MTRPVPVSRRLQAVGALGLALLLLGLGKEASAAPAASSPGSATAGLAPAPGSKGLVLGGGYFAPHIAAGSTYSGAVLVGNDSDSPLPAVVYPVDAVTAPAGGIGYSNEGVPLSGPGTWVHISKERITLAARVDALVAFSVTVPAGTAPGEYLAGIAAESAPPAAVGSGFRVIVRSRVIVAFEVIVPGASPVAAFSVGKPTLVELPDSGYEVRVPAKNTGTAIGGTSITVSLSGRTHASLTDEIPTVLPGDSVEVLTRQLVGTLGSGTYVVVACTPDHKSCAQATIVIAAIPEPTTTTTTVPVTTTTPNKPVVRIVIRKVVEKVRVPTGLSTSTYFVGGSVGFVGAMLLGEIGLLVSRRNRRRQAARGKHSRKHAAGRS